MRIDNQLTFTTYEASLKLKAHDPIKIIFDHIDWSFIHPLIKDKYSALPPGNKSMTSVPVLRELTPKRRAVTS